MRRPAGWRAFCNGPGYCFLCDSRGDVADVEARPGLGDRRSASCSVCVGNTRHAYCCPAALLIDILPL